MFCLLKLKKASLALRIESRLENIFSIGISCMLLAEERKCSAAMVGLDLVLGLSNMVRRCSLNLSFKRRLVSPIYCKLQRLH